jgi:hypothetical protein
VKSASVELFEALSPFENALSAEVLLGNAKGSGRAPQSTYINDCAVRVRWTRSMTFAYPAWLRHFDEKPTSRPSGLDIGSGLPTIRERQTRLTPNAVRTG